MTDTIKYFNLQKPELEYEVGLRGQVPGGTVAELRRQITALSAEQPGEDITESHMEPAADLLGVKATIQKLQASITALKTKPSDHNLALRTEAHLNHLKQRLSRINPDTDDTVTTLHACINIYNSCGKEFNTLRPAKPEATASTSRAAPATYTPEPITVHVSCDGNSSNISKLTYNGKTCVKSFIQKAEEYVHTRRLSSETLLARATEFLVDDALHWYRSVKDTICSWEDFCNKLSEAFLASDYNYRLLAEIRQRTQGEKENITVYSSIMHGLFSRLNSPLAEEQKLEILLHNIRPCYANVLAAAAEVSSTQQLITYCKNYENIQARLTHFREPPKSTTDTLAPDFAYTRQNTNNSNSNTNNTRRDLAKISEQPTPAPPAGGRSQNKQPPAAGSRNNHRYRRYCPRCMTDAHSLRECTAERVKLCFRCRLPGYTTPECPHCNPETPKNE